MVTRSASRSSSNTVLPSMAKSCRVNTTFHAACSRLDLRATCGLFRAGADLCSYPPILALAVDRGDKRKPSRDSRRTVYVAVPVFDSSEDVRMRVISQSRSVVSRRPSGSWSRRRRQSLDDPLARGAGDVSSLQTTLWLVEQEKTDNLQRLRSTHPHSFAALH